MIRAIFLSTALLLASSCTRSPYLPPALTTPRTVVSTTLPATLAWQTRLDEIVIREPVVAGHQVLLFTTNHLIALNAGTGAEEWRYQTHGGELTMPMAVGDNNVIYLGSTDDGLVAISSLNGEVLWQHEQIEDWVSSNVVADVAYAGGQVFAASATSGTVLAYDAADGSPQWSTPSLAWRDTSLQVVDDMLHVSTGLKVHKLSTRTGALTATVALPGGLAGAQYTPDLAYTPFQVVDTHTLQQRFWLETPRDRDPDHPCDLYWLPFALAPDAFYGATGCGVYRLNHLGKIDWRYYGDAPPEALTAEYGGYVYVLLQNGAIVALASTTGREVGRMQTSPRLLDYTKGGLETRGLINTKCGVVAVFNSYDVWGFTDPTSPSC